MAPPVLDGQNDEQRGQDEAQQCDVPTDQRRQPGARQGARRRPQSPRHVADRFDGEDVAAGHRRAILGSEQRIDLIGDGVNGVEPGEGAPAHTVQGEAQPVKDVPTRDEGRRRRDRRQWLARSRQGREQHLHRARVDDDAPQRRPPPRQPLGHQQHAGGQSQSRIADDNGHDVAQGVARGNRGRSPRSRRGGPG